jgi:hypothetical protein
VILIRLIHQLRLLEPLHTVYVDVSKPKGQSNLSKGPTCKTWHCPRFIYRTPYNLTVSSLVTQWSECRAYVVSPLNERLSKVGSSNLSWRTSFFVLAQMGPHTSPLSQIACTFARTIALECSSDLLVRICLWTDGTSPASVLPNCHADRDDVQIMGMAGPGSNSSATRFPVTFRAI